MVHVSDSLQKLRVGAFWTYDVMRHIRPSLMLDVGAAQGYLTKAVKERSPKTRVIAYEPFPGNHPHLDATVSGLDGVTVRRAAVGSRPGKARFYCDSIMPGARHPGASNIGYVVPDGVKRDPARCLEVEVVAIDDEVDEPVGLMKIDVQGGEADVLAGASRTVARHGIDIIYVEFDGDRRVLDFLLDHDYVVHDTEYMLFSGDEAAAREWLGDFERRPLTTGATAMFGHVQADIPRDRAGYCAWLRSIRLLFTDLLAVRRSFMPGFERAVEAEKARLAAAVNSA